jgi:hypothetical protein
VKASFGRAMQFAQKRPKSGGLEFNFEHQDCFLDNFFNISDKYNYAASILNGGCVKMPGKNFVRRNCDTIILRYRGNST